MILSVSDSQLADSAWKLIDMEHGQLRDRPGQHHVEPAQPGAPVGLGRSDGRRLDDDDAVELKALGHRGRDDINLMVHITMVCSQDPVINSIAAQRL